MSKIVVNNIVKKYNNQVVLNDISFDIKKGEFLSILGESGCGKTTLFRNLIGLEKLDKGNIIKDNVDITNVEPYKRNMGIVFQDFALFQNMTVKQNIEYVMKEKKSNEVIEIIKKMKLEDVQNKKVCFLSGGQKQRVAIARTLILKPDIILFDEPMSSLDVYIREELRDEIKKMQKEYNLTIIYITHDQEEAVSMSDRIMIIKDGKLQQIDTPYNILNNPANEYVDTFVCKQLDKKVKSILKNIKGL